MNEVYIEVLNVFEHFTYNSSNGKTYINGLYKINLNGNKAMIFRNGDSWGVLSHYLGEPVTKCIGYLREDRIEFVKSAIDKYLIDNITE